MRIRRLADAGGIGTEADVSGHRSDTIMILRRDKIHRRRLALVDPSRPVGTGARHDGKRRINSAFNDGPEVLVETLQQELGLPIHHYVEIDFSGFKSLVDALGGVQICVNYATRDVSTGLNITEPGCHILDGVQALAYARSRHYEEFARTRSGTRTRRRTSAGRSASNSSSTSPCRPRWIGSRSIRSRPAGW